MNDDLARSLDDLLSWLDRRYQPSIARTLTPRQYTAQWELDKIIFREKLMAVLDNTSGVIVDVKGVE